MRTISLIALALLSIAGIAGTVYFAAKYYTRPKTEEAKTQIADNTIQAVELDVKQINKKIYPDGIEHALLKDKEQLITSYNQLKDSSRKEIDSLNSLLGIRDKQLYHYIKITSVASRENEPMLETDTTYNFKDKWLSVDVRKPANGIPALLNSKYNAEHNLAWYWEDGRFLGIRSRIFGRGDLVGNFWLSDPTATIDGLKYLKIQPPADKFGFSMQAVGDYSPRGDVYFGVGATIRSGRFKLQGAYVNDFHGQWRPSFRANIDFIDW